MASAVKWCCQTFRDRYNSAGERTIAVIVSLGFEEKPEFYVQARAVAKNDEVPLRLPVTLTVVTEFVIHFCPWCGVRLSRWYSKNGESLIRAGLKIPME